MLESKTTGKPGESTVRGMDASMVSVLPYVVTDRSTVQKSNKISKDSILELTLTLKKEMGLKVLRFKPQGTTV